MKIETDASLQTRERSTAGCLSLSLPCLLHPLRGDSTDRVGVVLKRTFLIFQEAVFRNPERDACVEEDSPLFCFLEIDLSIPLIFRGHVPRQNDPCITIHVYTHT